MPPPVPAPVAPLSTETPIALLLPLDARDFRAAAEALRQGFLAARATDPRPQGVAVRATDASAESIVGAYEAAVAAGARVVVGPLTRDGVTALAQSGRASAATLALNQPETGVALPPRFYTFGLALDAEARYVARAAWGSERSERRGTAVLVSTPTALAKRVRDAFAEEWRALGGEVRTLYEVAAAHELGALKARLAADQHDLIFLAAETQAARLIRPYLGANAPVWATSLINDGRPDPTLMADMFGVHFVETPWLLSPASDLVSAYARTQGLSAELERFYALGIDAYRIALVLLAGETSFVMDGVSGQLSVAGGTVARRPTVARFGAEGATAAGE